MFFDPSVPFKVETDSFRRLEDVVRRLTQGDAMAEPELAKAWKKLSCEINGSWLSEWYIGGGGGGVVNGSIIHEICLYLYL